MKEVWKILTFVFVLSVLFLFHVHEQIMVFKVSYRLNEKSDLLAQRSEEYRRLKYQVDRLKAPRLLEEKIKEQSMELTLPKQVRVVQMPANKIAANAQSTDVPEKTSMKATAAGKVMSFLGHWVEVAQAKTEN